ncbi:hypothetical protein [Paraburkholderia nodosa]|uniref:hypothetical protein n=1 Tax=Paraburkholderia nodosa TaxID=392320 RepID=UPI0008416865|nr:hypothetical protein [Paraburkholderia nodosa]
MRTRKQFCPICQKQTLHQYKPVSVVVTLLLFLIFFPLALIYLVIAVPRANSSAFCTVDHERLQQAREDERLASMVRALQAAQIPPEARQRGTGFMSRG